MRFQFFSFIGLLLLILFITILTNRRKKVKEDVAAPAAGEAAAN